MASGNLVVMDADFLCAAEEFRKYEEFLNSLLDDYVEVMEYISMHGFVDGLITQNVMGIAQEVGRYPGKLKSTASEISTILKDFAVKIEDVDKFKY